MALDTRINTKTGKTQYRYKYCWCKGLDSKGRKDYSGRNETGWYDDEKTARMMMEERKKELEEGVRSETLRKLNSSLEDAFKEFRESMEKRKKKETTKYTTRASYASEAKTIANSDGYFPKRFKAIKIVNLKAHDFSEWLDAMNDVAGSGSTIRKYRAILKKFNDYLNAHGYYQQREGFHRAVIDCIDSVELMAKEEGQRTDLYTPTILDIQKITDHLKKTDKDDGKWRFENFYWYTLVKVFYFVGGRPEEMVALKWSDVNLKTKKISIANAIADKTPEEIVKKKEKQTKKPHSARTIKMLKVYEQLMADYKEASQYYYGYDAKQIEDAYVFPRVDKLRSRTGPQIYKNINNMLAIECPAAGVDYFSVERFRHGCATLFLHNEEFGIGLDEAREYFGHDKDTSDMLEKIYAKKNAKQKGSKSMEQKVSQIFADAEIEEEDDEIKQLIYDMFDENAIDYKQRKSKADRIAWQIRNAIKKGQEVYEYKKEDEQFIEKAIKSAEKQNKDIRKLIQIKRID